MLYAGPMKTPKQLIIGFIAATVGLVALAALFSGCTMATGGLYLSASDSTGVEWHGKNGASLKIATQNNSIPIKEGANGLAKVGMVGVMGIAAGGAR